MMNTKKDLLKDIFREIKIENTSNNFMKNLMVHIEKETSKQQRKKQIYNCLGLMAGMIGMVGIPALILFFFGIDISSKMNMSNIFGEIHIKSSYIIFALIILFLLVGDTLLRTPSLFFKQRE